MPPTRSASTRGDLKQGDLIGAGYQSNYGSLKQSNHPRTERKRQGSWPSTRSHPTGRPKETSWSTNNLQAATGLPGLVGYAYDRALRGVHLDRLLKAGPYPAALGVPHEDDLSD